MGTSYDRTMNTQVFTFILLVASCATAENAPHEEAFQTPSTSFVEAFEQGFNGVPLPEDGFGNVVLLKEKESPAVTACHDKCDVQKRKDYKTLKSIIVIEKKNKYEAASKKKLKACAAVCDAMSEKEASKKAHAEKEFAGDKNEPRSKCEAGCESLEARARKDSKRWKGKALAAFVKKMKGQVEACHDSCKYARVAPSKKGKKKKKAHRKGGDRHQALKNVQALKSYCIAAYDKAKSLKADHVSMSISALVDLVMQYGQGMGKNIVTDYAKVTGKLRATYKRGIGRYIIDNLDRAVVFGRGIVMVKRDIRGAWRAFFNSRKLQFMDQPAYFRRLAVRLSDYEAAKGKVSSASSGADAEAASAWLRKRTKSEYKSFLMRIMARVKKTQEGLWKQVYRGALRSERAAWKIKPALKPQGPSGVAGATKVLKRIMKKWKNKIPSFAKIKKAARAAAAAWRKSNNKASVGKVIERI